MTDILPEAVDALQQIVLFLDDVVGGASSSANRKAQANEVVLDVHSSNNEVEMKELLLR